MQLSLLKGNDFMRLPFSSKLHVWEDFWQTSRLEAVLYSGVSLLDPCVCGQVTDAGLMYF